MIEDFTTAPALCIQRGIASFGMLEVKGASRDLHTAIRLDSGDNIAPHILGTINEQLVTIQSTRSPISR